MENLFNINQVAFILKVHQLTIRRYIKEGKIKAIRAAGNIRIRESELQQFTKDFAPSPHRYRVSSRKTPPLKRFTPDDPLLRLQGRGAHIHLEH